MAAALTASADFYDLITCAVCKDRYDPRRRLPKVLHCSHTFCLPCLQAVNKAGSVQCPVCCVTTTLTNGVDCLPNNPYALHMIHHAPTPIETYWCWFCKSEARPDCQQAHRVISVEAGDLRDAGRLQNFIADLGAELGRSVERRTTVHSSYQRLLSSLEAAISEIRQQVEVNEDRLTELMSLQDQYYSMINDEKNYRSLRDRGQVLSDAIRQQSSAIDTFWEEMRSRDQIRISIQLRDSHDQKMPTSETFDSGFQCRFLAEDQLSPSDVNTDLLSHLILTALRDRDIARAPSASDDGFAEATGSAAVSFDCRSDVFVLKVHVNNRLGGQVRIRPSAAFNADFMNELGRFCLEGGRPFSANVTHTVRESLLALDFHNAHFHPPSASGDWSHQLVDTVSDVGFYVTKDADGRFKSMSLAFLLSDYNRNSLVGRRVLFGRMIAGHELIRQFTLGRYSNCSVTVTWHVQSANASVD